MNSRTILKFVLGIGMVLSLMACPIIVDPGTGDIPPDNNEPDYNIAHVQAVSAAMVDGILTNYQDEFASAAEDAILAMDGLSTTTLAEDMIEPAMDALVNEIADADETDDMKVLMLSTIAGNTIPAASITSDSLPSNASIRFSSSRSGSINFSLSVNFESLIRRWTKKAQQSLNKLNVSNETISEKAGNIVGAIIESADKNGFDDESLDKTIEAVTQGAFEGISEDLEANESSETIAAKLKDLTQKVVNAAIDVTINNTRNGGDETAALEKAAKIIRVATQSIQTVSEKVTKIPQSEVEESVVRAVTQAVVKKSVESSTLSQLNEGEGAAGILIKEVVKAQIENARSQNRSTEEQASILTTVLAEASLSVENASDREIASSGGSKQSLAQKIAEQVLVAADESSIDRDDAKAAASAAVNQVADQVTTSVDVETASTRAAEIRENTPPSISFNDGTTLEVEQDEPFSISATVTDPDENDPLVMSWSVVTQPAGTIGFIDQFNTDTDDVTEFTDLVATFPGTYRIRLRVNDGTSDPVSKVLTLTVNAKPLEPNSLEELGQKMRDALELSLFKFVDENGMLLPNPTVPDIAATKQILAKMTQTNPEFFPAAGALALFDLLEIPVQPEIKSLFTTLGVTGYPKNLQEMLNQVTDFVVSLSSEEPSDADPLAVLGLDVTVPGNDDPDFAEKVTQVIDNVKNLKSSQYFVDKAAGIISYSIDVLDQLLGGFEAAASDGISFTYHSAFTTADQAEQAGWPGFYYKNVDGDLIYEPIVFTIGLSELNILRAQFKVAAAVLELVQAYNFDVNEGYYSWMVENLVAQLALGPVPEEQFPSEGLLSGETLELRAEAKIHLDRSKSLVNEAVQLFSDSLDEIAARRNSEYLLDPTNDLFDRFVGLPEDPEIAIQGIARYVKETAQSFNDAIQNPEVPFIVYNDVSQASIFDNSFTYPEAQLWDTITYGEGGYYYNPISKAIYIGAFFDGDIGGISSVLTLQSDRREPQVYRGVLTNDWYDNIDGVSFEALGSEDTYDSSEAYYIRLEIPPVVDEFAFHANGVNGFNSEQAYFNNDSPWTWLEKVDGKLYLYDRIGSYQLSAVVPKGESFTLANGNRYISSGSYFFDRAIPLPNDDAYEADEPVAIDFGTSYQRSFHNGDDVDTFTLTVAEGEVKRIQIDATGDIDLYNNGGYPPAIVQSELGADPATPITSTHLASKSYDLGPGRYTFRLFPDGYSYGETFEFNHIGEYSFQVTELTSALDPYEGQVQSLSLDDEPLSSALSSRFDEDTYSFTLNDDATIIIDHEEYAYFLYRDEDMTDQITYNEYTGEYALEAGSYYLKVVFRTDWYRYIDRENVYYGPEGDLGDSVGLDGSYTIGIRSIEPRIGTDANEPNETFDDGTELTLGSELSGILSDVSDTDAFTFTIDTEGAYRILLTSIDPTLRLPTLSRLELLYQYEYEYMDSVTGRDNTQLYEVYLEPGTYGTTLSHSSSWVTVETPYTIVVEAIEVPTSENEPANDTTPEPLTIGTDISGSFYLLDDVDLYSFTLDQDAVVEFSIDSELNGQFMLKNSADEVIRYSHSGDWYDDLKVLLQADTYTVTVEIGNTYNIQSLDVSRDYTLTSEIVAGDSIEAQSPNETFETASELSIDQVYDANFHHYQDEDYYSFTLEEPRFLTIRVRSNERLNLRLWSDAFNSSYSYPYNTISDSVRIDQVFEPGTHVFSVGRTYNSNYILDYMVEVSNNVRN